MVNIRQRTAPQREKRLGTLSAWYGSISSLLREASEGELVQRIRTFAQETPSDLILGLELLATLRGVAIVVHGPAGCAAGLHQSQNPDLHWAVTRINERDSILGGDTKLRATIRQLYADHQPNAILIVSSPVVIINNDDIDSVVEELREELGIPLIPVFTDGFRSKVAATGYDVVSHALLKELLAHPATTPTTAPPSAQSSNPHVTLLSVQESGAAIASLQALLAELDIASQPFPRYFDLHDGERITSARLSVTLDGGTADYAGQILQEQLGQPYLNPPAPIGIAATRQWLTAIAEPLGRQAAAAALIQQQEQQLASALQAATQVRGRKVFIHLAAGPALSLWHLAQEIGLEVVGIKVPFLDNSQLPALHEIARSQENLPILVGHGQAFEEIALLKSARPDLYISHGIDALPAARLGIATLPLDQLNIQGFAGVSTLLQHIERRLNHAHLQRFLAEGENEPYSHGWLKKSAYWYIKQEVR